MAKKHKKTKKQKIKGMSNVQTRHSQIMSRKNCPTKQLKVYDTQIKQEIKALLINTVRNCLQRPTLLLKR